MTRLTSKLSNGPRRSVGHLLAGLLFLILVPVVTPGAHAQIITSRKDVAILQTPAGKIVVEFFDDTAPRSVAAFKKNIREGAYERTVVHRILTGLAILAGDPFTADDDPTNDGWGGFGVPIPNEFNEAHLNVRSAIGALRKPDDVNPDKAWNGFQFYILLSDQPKLDASQHTVFARVKEGMDIVDRLAGSNHDPNGVPKDRLEFKKIYLESR